jgi:hypothetical protein
MTRLGIVARALNEPRNLTSTIATPQKTTLKITTKIREAKKDKQRCSILTLMNSLRPQKKFSPKVGFFLHDCPVFLLMGRE